MTEKNEAQAVYDDGNIPEIDFPRDIQEFKQPKDNWITEPLPESTRPRQDGPGGEGLSSHVR